MPARPFFALSVSRLVIVGGILAALLPVALLAIGYTLKTRDMMVETTLAQNELFAGEAALYVDRVLTDHRNTMSFVGREIGNGPQDPARTQAILARMRATLPLFARVLVVAPNGIVQSAEPAATDNGKSVLGVNISDRDYFQTVMRTGAATIDPELLLGRSSGVPIMIIAAPIVDADGKVLGVLVGSVDLDTLTLLIERLHLGSTGHAVVVTRTGITVAHPDPQRVSQRFSFAGLPIWTHLSAREAGRITSYIDETGTPRFAAFATVPSTGWKLWLSQTHEELNGEFYNLLTASSIWPLGAIAVGIALTALLARMIARPIERLHHTAEEITAGHLERRAPESGPTELASLAAAINEMASALQSRIQAEQAARVALEHTVTAYGQFTERVTAGDFSTRLTVENAGALERLGHGLNTMATGLDLLVGEIKAATSQLGSASAEILAATSQQAAATAEEAAAVRQMAASVHELRQAGESVARRTQTVVDMAQKTEAIAETGLGSVEATVRSTEDGRQRLETLAERVMGFSEQTYEIAEINAAVSEIAEKSNLLAVNASIEAAKAGEAGRGFAVVATEIRELAEQSKAATAQVRRIIADIQRSAQAAVLAAEQYAKTADVTVATSRQAGSAISSLANRVTEASQAARQNLAAAEQQQAGIGQIALAVDNIETSSSQTVAATAQVEQSARNLHDLAQALEVIVDRVSVRPGTERPVS